MNKYRDFVVFISLLAASSVAFSNGGAVGEHIYRIRSHANGFTYFGVDVRPTDVCSSYGEYFVFDHRTETGKAFLSTLLAAKTAQKPIDIWYNSSGAPGTDASNGCSDSAMALLIGVALSQ